VTNQGDQAGRSDLKWCRAVHFTDETVAAKDDVAEPRRYQHRLRFTREYCAGIVSGIGLGAAILAYPMQFEAVRLFPLAILSIGLFVAIGAEFGRLSQRDKREGRNSTTDADEQRRHGLRNLLTSEYFAGICLGIGFCIASLTGVPRDSLAGVGWLFAALSGLALIAIGYIMRLRLRRPATKE
jgi:hypothetical protein